MPDVTTMTEPPRLATVLKTERRNAVLSWVTTAFLGAVVVASLLAGDYLGAGFATVVLVLALLPPLAHRHPSLMLPWEVLVLAGLPLIGRVLATVQLTSQFATYLAVAAVALIVAVQLQLFTPVRMSSGFAVLFVVIATMAAAGLWAIARWGLDVTLGTAFLLEPGLHEEVIEARLMWEFVYSTAAGVAAGLVFEGYFRRRARLEARVSENAEGTGP